jgi:hypothetical protein
MGDLQQMDASLASLAREDAVLRLRLGQLLEVISRGAVFELGFSSFNAYAIERCERSGRWAEAARCLARRLEKLPRLRRAMAMARVSWSMGELVARVATAHNEERWLELAQGRTVRQMRVLVAEAMTTTPEVTSSGTGERAASIEQQCSTVGVGCTPDAGDGDLAVLQSGSDEICALTCTVDREDFWLFEATRCLLEQLGVNGSVAQVDALLAEVQGTLLASLPDETIDLEGLHHRSLVQQRWEQQLRDWRNEAEASCEKKLVDELLWARANSEPSERMYSVVLASSIGIGPLEHASCSVLDQQVRALAALMARHELDLSILLLRFHRGDGWRTLGYATETQYARERLGLSRSSLLARRALALRLEKLPDVAAALAVAQIGVEAALQLVRIATPSTEAAWVERARRRTIKHLREEVSAALTAVRLTGECDCLPPEQTDMAAFQTLEQTVVSGQFARPRRATEVPGAAESPPTSSPRQSAEPTSNARRPWRAMLGSLASWLDDTIQMSASASASMPSVLAFRPRSSAGRVTLRLRMSREAYRWWRALEAQARRWLPPRVSWLRYLCLSVWHAWRHLLGTDVAYGHIYIRDRFRCTSPVCNRRDVTPHHIQFRSAGGGDAAYNLTSPCAWCHLHGIHGGRIRARGTANHIHWELGPQSAPCLIVHGRERMVA